MEIFLVRHGETDGNVARRHQVDKTKLTARGRTQANEVATTLAALKPTHLVTSSLVRAIETAQVIGDACGLVPMTSPHFTELVRPAPLYGNFHHSPRSLLFYLQWYFGLTQSGAGESYQALRERLAAARAELATYPADARVVVVSHTAFINFFLVHCCRDRALNPFQAAATFYRILTMPNGSITTLHFLPHETNKTCAWSVEKALES